MSYILDAFENDGFNMDIILEGLQEYDKKLSFSFENSDMPLIISVMERRLDAYKGMATKQQLDLADAITEGIQPSSTLIQIPIPKKKRGEQK